MNPTKLDVFLVSFINRAAIRLNFLMNCMLYPTNPIKLHTSVGVVDYFHSLTVITLFGFIDTSTTNTTCPRKLTSSFQKEHLLNFVYNF